jgi:molecular chaperone DnaJ
MRNLYRILGLPHGAPSEEVKRAYRQRATKLHPDKNPHNPQAEEQFKEINAAYSILGNKQKKKIYDRNILNILYAYQEHVVKLQYIYQDLQKIYKDFLSMLVNTTTKSEPDKYIGKNLNINISIDFLTALFGGEYDIEIYRPSICSNCGGLGTRQKNHVLFCGFCHAKGFRHYPGRMKKDVRKKCSDCNGRGYKILQPCTNCEGKGVLSHPFSIRVCIPPFSQDGDVIHLHGLGECGTGGGTSGDLIVVFTVKPHPFFCFTPNTLVHTAVITAQEAQTGLMLTIPIGHIEHAIRIPPGTQPGQHFTCVVSEKALKNCINTLEVRIQVEIPTQKTDGTLHYPLKTHYRQFFPQ